MLKNEYLGKLIAFDGPNGSGKSTIINCLSEKLLKHNIDFFLTKEPTESALGNFTRNAEEYLKGESFACLVAADRYQHLEEIIIPKLQEGKLVITDRYILSSLILQSLDNVDISFLMKIHEKVIAPNLQIALSAKPEILIERLKKRKTLSRFEKDNSSLEELKFMRLGLTTLQKENVDILEIDNSDNLEENTEIIMKKILSIY
jgi:dTMP kinase